MADTRILFVMINLTQSLQWESSWIVSDKIAFHSPLNFPAIFLFFPLCAELWSDWTYCVSVTAHKYRDCWSSLLPIAEHKVFVPEWDVQHLKQNYAYSGKMTDQNLNTLQSFLWNCRKPKSLVDKMLTQYIKASELSFKIVTTYNIDL